MNQNLSDKINEYIKEKHDRLIRSVLVYHYGEVIVENYYNSCDENTKHQIKSIWKSIISLCIGICVDRGMLELDDPIKQYLEAFDQKLHPYHRILKVKDLLTMRSGIYWNGGIHYHCPMLAQMWRSDDWVEYIADGAMDSVPGREFVYKEWDIILLSALLAKVTDNSAYDFCNDNIYKPLNIISDRWGHGSGMINYNHIPGSEDSTNLTALDLLKIGKLLLQEGEWEGKSIVSKSYVKQMTTSEHPEKTYGYLTWLYHGYYACRGFGGQEIIVSPKKDLVTVIQAEASSSGKSYEELYTELIQKSV